MPRLLLIYILSCVFASQAQAKSCVARAIESAIAQRIFDTATPTVRNLMHKESFIKASKAHNEARKLNPELTELSVHMPNLEQATNFTFESPLLREFGFPSYALWTPVEARLNPTLKTINAAIDQNKMRLPKIRVGSWFKKPNGDYARVRLDWDEVKGGHYNIEVVAKNDNGVFEEHNLAVLFNCDGARCTEDQYLKMVENLQGQRLPRPLRSLAQEARDALKAAP